MQEKQEKITKEEGKKKKLQKQKQSY